MTKIKNTKKGMAKKTLSISLAVAMLATSNVPVWAAEFTDGSEAVFTSEAPAEFVEEAPVVEDVVEDVPEAQVTDSKYSVTFKDATTGKFVSDLEWGRTYYTDITVTETEGKALKIDSLKVRWVNAADKTQVAEFGEAGDFVYNGNVATKHLDMTLEKQYIGNNYKLQVIEVNADGTVKNEVAVSPVITCAPRKLSGTVHFIEDEANSVHYTGYQIKDVPNFNESEIEYQWDYDKKTVDADEVADDADIENFKAISGDTVNAYEYNPNQPDKQNVVVEGKINGTLYTGTVTGEFNIWRKVVDTAKDAVKVELPKYTYQYTGDYIKVKKEVVKTTERTIGNVVTNAVAEDFEVGKAVEVKEGAAEKFAKVVKTGKFLNYVTDGWWNAGDVAKVGLDEKLEVVKRDLADTANTKIEIGTLTEDEFTGLSANKTVTPAMVKQMLSINDTDSVNLVSTTVDKKDVIVTLKGANDDGNIVVDGAGTYTAVVSAPANDKNFKGSREVTFKVVPHDLNTATFEKEAQFETAVEYIGSQITRGLTKDNLAEKLGVLKDAANQPLSAGVDYDVNVKFGENVNAGKGQIIIEGKGDAYRGTQKVIEFDITPRILKKEDIVVPAEVLYNINYHKAEDYDFATSIVAKFESTANGTKKAYEVTVPTADYEVSKAYQDTAKGNEVGNNILTSVKCVNANSNFNFSTLGASDTGVTRIAYRAIEEADVILEKTEYTYAAKPIVPEYKVVVAGETLVEGKDFTYEVIHNTDVGEATLTITGKGDYDDKTSVSKKFNIVAANISDLVVAAIDGKVVYNGASHKDLNELTVKLGDVDLVTAKAPNKTTTLFADNLVYEFPNSKTANINAGDATVTIKPAKDNKNFVGEKTFTFKVSPAEISGGVVTAFDKFGTKVDFTKDGFTYDGTKKEYTTTKYARPTTDSEVVSPMKFTANDYDIVYVDNVTGKNHVGAILVVAKGNYAGVEGSDASEYECADGTIIKNVIITQTFNIAGLNLNIADAVVENAQYAEGKEVDPVVTVSYKGKTLVKNVDYKLTYPGSYGYQDRTEVTNGKTLMVRIEGIGGYTGIVRPTLIEWGIDKFDLGNADIIVTGTTANPVVKVLNGSTVVSADEYDITVSEDGKTATISADKDSKHYTGSQEVPFDAEPVGTPMITDVKVVGNKATVVLSGEVDNAFGYDYVIATEEDYKNGRVDITKNQLKTTGDFFYVQKGVYYAYCHAYKKDTVTGKKVFGGWSNIERFEVTATTPETPVITSVTRSGSTVKVTYKAVAGAEGYDIVLGSARRSVNGELRPVEYGTLVKKNQTTTTVTFKNVPAGSYYVGLHAYNRTSLDNKKVFSRWANWSSRVTVR